MKRSARVLYLLVTIGALLALAACTGEVVSPLGDGVNEGGYVNNGPVGDNNGGGNNGGVNNGANNGANNGGNNGGVDVEPCLSAPCSTPDGSHPSVTTRFTRLTHSQWENTVRDLFRMDEVPNVANTFIPDPTSVGFSTNTGSLDVTPELWKDYQRGSETIAERVVRDPDLLARVQPQPLPEGYEARRDAFLSSFLARAYRRTPTSDELTRYRVLFDEAADLLVEDDRYLAGVQMTIRAALQSPHFLFRVELSDTEQQGKIQLQGFEVASRLSYTLWNTMPSDELLAAAADGELDTIEGVQLWIVDMLDDARGHEVVAAFHQELLRTNLYTDITKNGERFPEFEADSGRYMKTEVELFIEDLVFAQDGTFGDLMTSRRTFVNANLASIYGVEGSFDDAFSPVDLDPAERSGLLTRLGFLAANANAILHDPIHRGVFIAHHILCKDLPAPPDVVPPLPADNGDTMRERVENHTGDGTCGAGCHSVYINPPGFAFEHYDALGRYRTQENGFGVDSADTYTVDGRPTDFNDARSFSEVVADSHEGNNCYTRHWLEYMYGREANERDESLIATIAEGSRQGELTIEELMLALLLNDAFLTRAPEEMQ